MKSLGISEVLLVCKDIVDEHLIDINGDYYYGKAMTGGKENPLDFVLSMNM